jgi:SNF2 family DNA or RNA helicase
MAQVLKILTSESSLRTSLQYDSPSDNVFSTLVLILSATSDDVEFSDKEISLEWHLFKKNLITIAKILRAGDVELRPDSFSEFLIQQYLDDASGFRGEATFVKISADQLRDVLSSSNFERQLTKQQERDVLKLLLIKHGANFSVPGAGKTAAILAIHSVLRSLGKVDRLFVVAPINAFISWEDELASIYSGTKKTVRLEPSSFSNFHLVEQQDPDLILVNYEKMRKGIDKLYPFFVNNKVHIVLDESHRIKGGDKNLSFRQIVKLADISTRRDILSGTPMPQSVADLAPQFDFLWSQDVVGEFTDKYDEQQVSNVNRKIKKYFARTTKKELGLKEPVIKYEYVQMGPVQEELYKLLRSEAARLTFGLDQNTKEYYRQIGKSTVGLLQASTNPMLLGTNDEYFQESLPMPEGSKMWQLLSDFAKYEKAAKIEFLKNRVREILSKDNSNKIVVWSYFVRNVKLLEKIFSDYSPVSIYGAIPSSFDSEVDSRENRIRRFHNDPECRLMIANPQAGGEGISLHRVCHYAIYLDRNFNAAHYLQSLDRIHRLGLDKSVETYIEILVAKDSIDEVLIKRLNSKTKLMGRVLDDPGLAKLAYDPEDMTDQDLMLDQEDIKSVVAHISS